MLLNKQQVMDYLPHRDPFLFIDSVQEINLPATIHELEVVTSRDLVNTHVVAKFNVKEDMPILKGHFPGNPILPGVIQVEMMAQASAFSSLGLTKLNLNNPISVDTVLMTVNSARFRRPILPGMELEIHSNLSKSRGEVAIYDCEVYSGGEKVSEAQIIAKLTIIKES